MPKYVVDGYDKLIAGMVGPFITVSVIVRAGGIRERGTVLGVVDQTEDGTWIVDVVDSTATDGSETPFGILADPEVDATTEDVRATAFTSGEFNRDALIFGGTDTVDMHELAMRNVGLHTKRVVG